MAIREELARTRGIRPRPIELSRPESARMVTTLPTPAAAGAYARGLVPRGVEALRGLSGTVRGLSPVREMYGLAGGASEFIGGLRGQVPPATAAVPEPAMMRGTERTAISPRPEDIVIEPQPLGEISPAVTAPAAAGIRRPVQTALPTPATPNISYSRLIGEGGEDFGIRETIQGGPTDPYAMRMAGIQKTMADTGEAQAQAGLAGAQAQEIPGAAISTRGLQAAQAQEAMARAGAAGEGRWETVTYEEPGTRETLYAPVKKAVQVHTLTGEQRPVGGIQAPSTAIATLAAQLNPAQQKRAVKYGTENPTEDKASILRRVIAGEI